jgi:hypothetical protein
MKQSKKKEVQYNQLECQLGKEAFCDKLTPGPSRVEKLLP